MSHRVRYITKVEQIRGIDSSERDVCNLVAQKYAFRANDYYLGLIDWSDPDDPIRRIVIPQPEELHEWGEVDASRESAVTVGHGIQHKYADTALLLCNEICGAYCRYCFRKRLFMNGNDEASKDVSEGLAYIRAHPEITDVLLSGGDPLLMSARRLDEIIGELQSIPHVKTVRIGTKIPAFNPYRILEDEAFQDVLRRRSSWRGRIYIMAHFDHPRELTEPAIESLVLMQSLGAQMLNQCPLLRGINDDVDVLVEMWEMLTNIGCPQYYIFQNRPTIGNEPFMLPLVRGFGLVNEARKCVSGLSRRARYAMSHASGKVEMVGIDDSFMYCRYHRAKDPRDDGRVLTFYRDDEAIWLNDLQPIDLADVPQEFSARYST